MNHFINHAMEHLIRFRLKWAEKKEEEESERPSVLHLLKIRIHLNQHNIACYSFKILIRLRLAQIPLANSR